MKLWWLTDFKRVGVEKASVDQLAADESWFSLSRWRINSSRLLADGVITAHGVEYPIRLVYPDQFPSVPAWVEPQDPEVKWSSHQYGKGGPLCLELRPDNWSPEATGADMLRSAYNLLETENPLGADDHGKVPSAHNVNDIQSYDWRENPVFIGSGCLERIRNGSAENIRALRWMAENDDIWPILVYDAEDSTKVYHPPSIDLSSLRFEIPVLVAKAAPPNPVPADRMTLASALTIDEASLPQNGGLVIVTVNENEVIPYHSPTIESVYPRKWVVISDEHGLRSGRAMEATDKRVAIIGQGSVGSKISEMLVRSGINRLLIVDGDVFLPANLERHILDWRDVGFRKVNAVKRRLNQIKPGASIIAEPYNLNWQRSAKTHAILFDDLAGCDLIVDATGDIPSSLMLGAVASENMKPFVSVTVFEGGLGALIARSIPGVDPTYVTGHAAYNAFCEAQNISPPKSGSKTYESINESGDPLVADDVAATIAAGHTARVVLDILDRTVGPQDRSWMLIGFRSGWLFSGHGHTISLDVGPATSPVEPINDEEARMFAFALAKEELDAIASPT